jgi:hypothetical protein
MEEAKTNAKKRGVNVGINGRWVRGAGKNSWKQHATVRVARWRNFRPKIPIWVNFGGFLRWKTVVYFVAIWYILW